MVLSRKYSIAAIATVSLLAGVAQAAGFANVKITGASKDCFMGSMVAVGGVNIAAFQVSAAPAIVAKLDTMANFTGFATNDPLRFQKYDSMERQLQNLIVTTRALARATSAADGSFTLSFAPVDSVLVIGFADREDDLYFFGYKYLSGLATTSMLLDMSDGTCPQ